MFDSQRGASTSDGCNRITHAQERNNDDIFDHNPRFSVHKHYRTLRRRDLDGTLRPPKSTSIACYRQK